MVANELKEKVLAEPDTPVRELAEKTGASKAQIYSWRYEARRKAGEGRAVRKRRKAKAAPTALQSVTVDAERPGTAAALIGALESADAAAERVKVEIELSQTEIDQVLEGMSAAQRVAFLGAGLRAALLA